jgi:dihydroorotate dehydrogenase (NAD+) catalytic subunit
VDLASIGAVVSKGLFLKERSGHPPQRIVETPSGMLNAIGLQGIGVHRYIKEKLPELRRPRRHRTSSTSAAARSTSTSSWRASSRTPRACTRSRSTSPAPTSRKGGITFGCSLHGTFDVVSAIKKVTHLPVIPKLTPNVTDVASIAKSAEDAGADAVSLVNTVPGDGDRRRDAAAEAVEHRRRAERPGHPADCRAHGLRVPRAVKIPIIGMGGIATATDALEFMIAGATAVQVGTANFVDPFIWSKLLDGMRDYMQRHSSRVSRTSWAPSTPARGRSSGSAPSRPRRGQRRARRCSSPNS